MDRNTKKMMKMKWLFIQRPPIGSICDGGMSGSKHLKSYTNWNDGSQLPMQIFADIFRANENQPTNSTADFYFFKNEWRD